MIAELAISTESVLMIGMGTLAGVVGLLFKKTEKENARQILRADNCEAENKKCQAQHSDAREKVAVLANDVGHLREQLTYFREQSLRLMPPLPAMPPPSTPPPSGSATQPIA